MSDDTKDDSQKTEQPTEKRLEDARKKGQHINSREVGYFAMIAASAIILFGLGPWSANRFKNGLTPYLSNAHDMSAEGVDFGKVVIDLMHTLGGILLLIFGALLLTALVANIAQSGFHITAEKLKPKTQNISMAKGFKRIFSVQNLVELVKNVGKLFVIGWVVYLVLVPELSGLNEYVALSITRFMGGLQKLSLKVFIVILVFMVILAAADYAYQRYAYLKSLKMTKVEVKDETKSAEGDPHVKARLRQIRQDRARKRMMDAIPTASVVITNPTHFAVVLKYDHQTMDAPVVVAKGIDFLAQRIRKKALDHNVPIKEDPPLARALYAQVEINQAIPSEFYEVVSHVVKYVMDIDRSRVGL